jgi:RNA recognition motif-containing protein
MQMKIYVGNLPRETTEAQLRKLFEGYGKVDSLAISIDKSSGESRAFLDMPDQNNAFAAISALNSRDFAGRNLDVMEAGDRADDDRGIGRREVFGGRKGRK